jgi:hypothetical protein
VSCTGGNCATRCAQPQNCSVSCPGGDCRAG